ncbi:hypothetical protein BH09ACT10_BH09ACT10_02530 [soil metagenome]
MSNLPPEYPSYPGDEPTGGVPPNYPPPNPGYGAQPLIPFASWWSRVGASILDALIVIAIVIIPFVVGTAIAFKDAETREVYDSNTGDTITEITGGVSALGIVIMILSGFLYLGVSIWNSGVRQGKTGQSLGKKIVGIKVVKVADGQVLGTGTGILRMIMNYILGNLCFINYLWPLWDDKKQTWHDKIVGSVVLQAQ